MTYSSKTLACHGSDGYGCISPMALPMALPMATSTRHETVLWSNFLVNAPVVYGLLERRLLYFLTLYVKHRFTERNLGVPESWKELYFQMTDADLGEIGGKTNVLQTYEALSRIGEKFVPISFTNDKGQKVVGKVHWVDSFFYDPQTGKYEVRMSPEIMPYLINLTKSFTAFDAATAMLLSSKFGQKFYELCCQFSGDFRYTGTDGTRYKKNVVPISIADFRRIFNLDDIRDARTGKIITRGKYPNFKDVKRRVIAPSQEELYELYLAGHSNVWFDYWEGKERRKVTTIYLFVYTKENPKADSVSPWREGDKPLCPYEESYVAPAAPKERVDNTVWNDCPEEQLEVVFENLLNRYLKKDETWYYINRIKASQYKRRDLYLQAIQAITEKERQPKFSKATLAYKRKSIMQYVLKENLKEYGWHIEPPTTRRKKMEYNTPSFI